MATLRPTATATLTALTTTTEQLVCPACSHIIGIALLGDIDATYCPTHGQNCIAQHHVLLAVEVAYQVHLDVVVFKSYWTWRTADISADLDGLMKDVAPLLLVCMSARTLLRRLWSCMLRSTLFSYSVAFIAFGQY